MTSLEIKEFRKKYDLSQEELAALTSVSVRTVRSWEYGERNISKLAEKLLHNYTQYGDKPTVNKLAKFLKKGNEDLIEKKDPAFEELSVDDKLNFLYKQNEDLKDQLDDLALNMEISLAPILRHFKLKADENAGKLQGKTSIN